MKKSFLLAAIILFSASALSSVQTPEQVLGFKPGADRMLAHYDQIKKYLELLASETDRVQTSVIGQTTLKRDMVMAIISSANNLRSLDRWRDITRRLTMAEITPEEAEKMADEGKAIVFVGCNQHSSEIASSQMVLTLAYQLATSTAPEIRQILDQVILIILPSVNPDGQAMEVEWYNKYKGTKWESQYALALSQVCRPRQQPRLVQRGPAGDAARSQPALPCLVPAAHPGRTPDGQQRRPLLRAAIPVRPPPAFTRWCGAPSPCSARASPMIWSNAVWPGWLRTASSPAGGLARWMIPAGFTTFPVFFLKAASVALATPVYIEPEEVESDESRLNEERMFSPNPWRGGM